MRKIVFNSGMTLITEDVKGETVVIEAGIRTGSINENSMIRGGSHFVEHMVFEGTKKRSVSQIANDIEKLGGEIGAYTSPERTCFYVRIIKKHFDTALEVLADILCNAAFKKDSFEKEREVILNEIKLKEDEPRFHQWDLFQNALFTKHPARHPVIGYKKSIEVMKREDLVSYYKEKYSQSSLVVAIVGDLTSLGNIEKKLKDSFRRMPKGKQKIFTFFEPETTEKILRREIKEISQTYMVLGYKTALRKERDSYVFDVIQSILGRGLSGRLFEEIRTKRGLCYDVGSHHETGHAYGFFSAYLSTDKKNLETAKELVLLEVKRLENISTFDLLDAKNYIEGSFVLQNEDLMKHADNLVTFEISHDANAISSYLNKIKSITKEEIRNTKRTYLDKPYAMVVIEQRS